MAYNQKQYDTMKSAYDQMSFEQRQKAVDQYKDNADFQSFAKDYAMWGYGKATTNTPPTQPSNPAPAENNQILFRWGNQEAQRLPWYRESMPKEPVIYWGDKQFDPNEQLDQSRFTNPNAQVKVQAGNAKQTWMPDYQDDSDARMGEITNNLNAYWNTNREYFADRQTFNKVFSYDKRSEAQQAHFDSFWKRKEIDKKVAGYMDWKSVSLALEEGTLTKAQLEALKVQNPKVYTEYLEDQLNKKNLDLVNTGSKSRIFNEDEQISHNTDALTDMMKKLGFDMSADGRAKELYDKFKELKTDPKIDTMKKDYLEARKIYLQRRREFNTLPEKIRAQSTGASETLISARISKAQRLAYDELQTLADEAQIRKEEYALEYGEMKDEFQAFKDQADEDYRAFTSKMSSLWFAKGLLGFETPEQQRQGQLRQLEAQNQLTLQFEKDKIALQSELSDINSKDPKIQFNAVMKALDQYYKDFWSIILRPQAQAAQDIINLAKKEGISVGEAMRKDFTEPLQKKDGYKMTMNKNYGISNEPKDTSPKWSLSTDKNWNVTLNMTGQWTIPEEYTRQQRVQTYKQMLSWASNPEQIAQVVSWITDWTKGGQCAVFANDIAKASWSNIHFGSLLSEKKNPSWSYTKITTPQVWAFAVFNSPTSPKYGHVGIITSVNPDGSFTMKSSNRWWDEKVYTSNHSAGSALAMFMPNISNSFLQTATPQEIEDMKNVYEALMRIYPVNPDGSYKDGFTGAIGWSWNKVWGKVFGGESGLIPWSASASYKKNLDNFISLQILPNLWKLKGALSDKDIQFLKDSASPLGWDMSEKEFINNINEIKRKLEEKLWIQSSFDLWYDQLGELYGSWNIVATQLTGELSDLPL